MHYSNLVLIEKDGATDLDKAVESAMGAREEHGGFWDWFQIGGRWTGALDGYDPETDPENSEPCNLCGATGTRTDMKVANGCNGCGGTGIAKKWPTQWKKHSGDVAPIESVSADAYDKFFRVVVGTRDFGGKEYLPWKPTGECFREREKPPLDWLKKEYAGYLAVVVDNHS